MISVATASDWSSKARYCGSGVPAGWELGCHDMVDVVVVIYSVPSSASGFASPNSVFFI